MRKITLTILLFLSSIGLLVAQELPDVKTIKLNKRVQYKAAEPTVIKVIDYIFATPINSKNKLRRDAGEFLLKWMNGTPEYVFVLQEKETNYFNTDADLTLVYMAALAKFQMDNNSVKDQEKLVLGALQIALPYLSQQTDKSTWSKELWQLNDARVTGNLEAFLHR